MIKVSDYIIQRLAETYNVRHIFMITGGGAMHLNDSIGKCSQLQYICNHHEQACAIAAEGYARSTGKMGVVNVTTGPGGLNTLTGVMGQWTDSVPVLYISGQVKRETTISYYPDLNLRQIGDQEVDIISVVKPLTKFAEQITDSTNVKYLLDKAVYLACEGRPGPVWLDIPMDIQGAMMDENEQEEFTAPLLENAENDISKIVELLQNAERPLIIAGNGIKIADAKQDFLRLLENLKIPVVTTFNGMDIIHSDHPLFTGRIGTLGSRAGNFALQNADVVISIGSRNNIRQISYNWKNFTREGKLVVVDIDNEELNKPTVEPFIKLCIDAKEFIHQLSQYSFPNKWSSWINWCIYRKQKYPTVLPAYKDCKEGVQPYYFIEKLTQVLPDNAITVAGNGSACVVLFHAGIVKENQKFIWNSGCAAMGYDLPAAIGAAVGNPENPIICLAGDGSLMMNIQELSTVKHLKLPLKIIVLNNDGYISIKQTQEGFFNNNLVGCNPETGVGIPDFINVAEAFGLKTMRIETNDEIVEKIQALLTETEPILCEVMLNKEYKFIPKTSSEKKADGRMLSKPLEDLYPFLPRNEFLENMIVEPLKEN
ncbi:MAG: thiamine pyrophosphate-binding protein [Bacteroidales bacterium]